MTMTLSAIGYESSGLALTGYLADRAGQGRKPGILVAHEAPGLNDHIKQWTEDLAKLGYVAFAIDLYGNEGLSMDQARELNSELMSTPGLLFERANAGFQTLIAQSNVDASRLAVIGFCQGAMTALELARGGAPLSCIVGIHPGLMRPAGSVDGTIKSKVLMMVGDKDPVSPPELRAQFASEMDAMGVDWQMRIFGGVGHSYTNPGIDSFCMEGFAYDALAHKRSWELMRSMLEESLC